MENENKTSNVCVNICRVCLSTNEDSQHIFDVKENELEKKEIVNLPEKIRLCSSVKVLENDGLPSKICIQCISKINDAYKLRKQCQDSDVQLRELYGKVGKIYDITSPKIKKDQYCQTDYSFSCDLIKLDDTFSPVINHNHTTIRNHISNNKGIGEHNSKYVGECKEKEKKFNGLDKQNDSAKHVENKCEKINTERETSRTKRMAIFKRVTSLENLKNHKEKQRKYIKKNVNIKWDDSNNFIKETNSQNSYICFKCNNCYTNKSLLNIHVLSHEEKTFVCEECKKHFFQLDKLIEHSKLHTVKQKPSTVVCNICNRNFRKLDTMVRHLNIHKKSNPKEVFSILKEIRDKRKLENALQTKEVISETESGIERTRIRDKFSVSSDSQVDIDSKNVYLCTQKENGYSSSTLDTNIEKQNAYNGELPHCCKYCSKCYRSKKSFEKHLQIHIQKKFVCNVCNMKFFRQDRLNSHKNRYRHHEDSVSMDVQKPPDEKSAMKLINSWIREELDSDNEEKGFPCKTCGKSYDTRKSLLKHQASTHNSEQENCSSCGHMCICTQKSKDKQKLNEILRPYQCSECSKSFEKELKLQKHVKIHERAKEKQDANFKRFLCHICSKTFRQNTGLKFHMRTHTGYKPYVCKYCGRGFTSNSNCINHERTHTGDRPFVCHFCSAAFAKSCTLKAHITTHTGEANYHCKTCGKSFRRLKYLKEHMFTHTGEKPYACKICGTAYSHSGSLFAHEKKCKAQYDIQIAQDYCETEMSLPNVTPTITIFPNSNNTAAMNTQTDKTYMYNCQRMDSQGSDDIRNVNGSNSHSKFNSDIPNVSLTVKSSVLVANCFNSRAI